jgi:hypothetical protein
VTTRSRILSFNQDFIIEVDTQSGTTLAHRTNTVRSPDDNETFAIIFNNGYGLELYKSEDRDFIILNLIEKIETIIVYLLLLGQVHQMKNMQTVLSQIKEFG